MSGFDQSFNNPKASEAADASDFGYRPITQIAPEDVVIAAYPKSGSHWLQAILAGILFGLRPNRAPTELLRELLPDVHAQTHFKRFVTPTVFKSHFLPKPEYRRVINLVRDGRDVLVSYLYHDGKDSLKPADYRRHVGPKANVWPSRWHEHVEQWAANPYQAEIITLRYEDLHRDPLPCLRGICRLAGLTRSDEELSEAYENARIDRLRELEARDGEGWLRGKSFFRRGIVGSHRDELPTEVRQAFEAKSGDALRRLGYL